VQQRARLDAEHRHEPAAAPVLERAPDDEEDRRPGDEEQRRGGGGEQREGCEIGHAMTTDRPADCRPFAAQPER
jgi:hypothetical protein